VAAFGKRTNSPAELAGDATLEFGAETAVVVKDPDPRPAVTSVSLRRPAQILAATVLIGGMAAAVYWADRLKVPTAPPSGSLRIETDSPGAEVRVDGTVRGTTPVSLSIPTGQHVITVQRGTNSKQVPVSIVANASTVYHITLPETVAPPVAESGSLNIATDTPGGQVTIDGEDRGTTPLTVKSLSLGQHRVVVKNAGATYTRTVQIEAGTTASLVLSGNGVPSWGFLSVTTPVAVQVFEGQRLIGTSDVDRIMLPGGDHELDMVADAIGYRATRKVKVNAGQTATLTLDLPKTPVSINAIPWAEVLVDGTRLGETPIGNVSITPGPHEIVFRHPQLGERRLKAVISLKDPNRLSMDMRPR